MSPEHMLDRLQSLNLDTVGRLAILTVSWRLEADRLESIVVADRSLGKDPDVAMVKGIVQQLRSCADVVETIIGKRSREHNQLAQEED